MYLQLNLENMLKDDINMALSALFGVPKRACRKKHEDKGKFARIFDEVYDGFDEDFLPHNKEKSEKDKDMVNI